MGRYRPKAMARGALMNLIGTPALPVAVRIGVTVPVSWWKTW